MHETQSAARDIPSWPPYMAKFSWGSRALPSERADRPWKVGTAVQAKEYAPGNKQRAGGKCEFCGKRLKTRPVNLGSYVSGLKESPVGDFFRTKEIVPVCHHCSRTQTWAEPSA